MYTLCVAPSSCRLLTSRDVGRQDMGKCFNTSGLRQLWICSNLAITATRSEARGESGRLGTTGQHLPALRHGPVLAWIPSRRGEKQIHRWSPRCQTALSMSSSIDNRHLTD